MGVAPSNAAGEGRDSLAKLGALIIHGMGNQEADFANDMIAELSSRISGLGASPADVAWRSVHWAPVLSTKQDQLWDDLSGSNNLDWAWLRKFVINSLGDAIAYLKRVPNQPPDVYQQIHQKVHDAVVDLRSDLGNEDKPLIVIAHSLGSIIMSNYIWDEQNPVPSAGLGFGGTPFEKMETLTGFFTFGSNIALVSLAYDPIVGIAFPSPSLASHFPAGTPPADLQSAAKWVNFYDADDVLGYPLKPLSASYDAAVREDREINVGGLLTSMTPLSHVKYWTDNDLTVPIAQGIADVLKLL